MSKAYSDLVKSVFSAESGLKHMSNPDLSDMGVVEIDFTPGSVAEGDAAILEASLTSKGFEVFPSDLVSNEHNSLKAESFKVVKPRSDRPANVFFDHSHLASLEPTKVIQVIRMSDVTDPESDLETDVITYAPDADDEVVRYLESQGYEIVRTADEVVEVVKRITA